MKKDDKKAVCKRTQVMSLELSWNNRRRVSLAFYKNSIEHTFYVCIRQLLIH